jgi:hypothetical protein
MLRRGGVDGAAAVSGSGGAACGVARCGKRSIPRDERYVRGELTHLTNRKPT